MAIVAYNRLQLLGSIVTGDIWSCTINFGNATGEAGPSDEATLTAAAARVKALQGGSVVGANLRAFMSDAYALTGFKLSAVNGSTHRETAQAAVTFGGPVAGSGDPVQAPEIAACVSWNLESANRNNRGRIFWPGVGRGVNANMRYSSADCTNLKDGMIEFLQQLAGAIEPGPGSNNGSPTGGAFQAIVVSKVKGTAVAIQTVSVGDVPDVQRRRRNKEREAYSVGPVTY